MSGINSQEAFLTLKKRLEQKDPSLRYIDFPLGLSDEQINTILVLMCNNAIQGKLYITKLSVANIELNTPNISLLVMTLLNSPQIDELVLNEPIRNAPHPRSIVTVTQILKAGSNLGTLRVCIDKDPEPSETYMFAPIMEAILHTRIHNFDIERTNDIDEREWAIFARRVGQLNARAQNLSPHELTGLPIHHLGPLARGSSAMSAESPDTSSISPIDARASATPSPYARVPSPSIAPFLDQFIDRYWVLYNQYIDITEAELQPININQKFKLNPLMRQLVTKAFEKSRYYCTDPHTNTAILRRLNDMQVGANDGSFMCIHPAEIGSAILPEPQKQFCKEIRDRFHDILQIPPVDMRTGRGSDKRQRN